MDWGALNDGTGLVICGIPLKAIVVQKSNRKEDCAKKLLIHDMIFAKPVRRTINLR